MPRKPNATPDAHMIYSDGSWRIYWRYKGKRYAVAAGYSSLEEKKQAELLRRDVASALGKEPPSFPEKIADSAAVLRYLADRYPEAARDPDAPPPSSQEMLDDYLAELKTDVSPMWATNSKFYLERLMKQAGALEKVTAKVASKHLAELMSVHDLRISSRNRALAAYKRFYRWAVESERLAENPFKAAKMLTEAPPEYIAHCSKEDRQRILEAARKLNREDWIAVAIAFYAGCRREEIYRLQWEDVFFDSNRLIIRISKTDRQRDTPLAKPLREILEPLRKPFGPVVPTVKSKGRRKNETWENRADRLIELLRGILCRPLNPDENGKAGESVGKRKFIISDADLRNMPEGLAALEKSHARTKDADKKKALAEKIAANKNCPAVAYDGGTWMPAERVGWTPFRHTFASLLVQNGVTLDKISSWMGNTPDVCRRHYAQFMPMGQKDEDIDKLV